MIVSGLELSLAACLMPSWLPSTTVTQYGSWFTSFLFYKNHVGHLAPRVAFDTSIPYGSPFLVMLIFLASIRANHFCGWASQLPTFTQCLIPSKRLKSLNSLL